jgi:hypothetical protein
MIQSMHSTTDERRMQIVFGHLETARTIIFFGIPTPPEVVPTKSDDLRILRKGSLSTPSRIGCRYCPRVTSNAERMLMLYFNTFKPHLRRPLQAYTIPREILEKKGLPNCLEALPVPHPQRRHRRQMPSLPCVDGARRKPARPIIVEGKARHRLRQVDRPRATLQRVTQQRVRTRGPRRLPERPQMPLPVLMKILALPIFSAQNAPTSPGLRAQIHATVLADTRQALSDIPLNKAANAPKQWNQALQFTSAFFRQAIDFTSRFRGTQGYVHEDCLRDTKPVLVTSIVEDGWNWLAWVMG